jgi:uncharacterized protein YbaR (Trm112 family)
MLTSHLARLGLTCPACRAPGQSGAPLHVRLALHTESSRAGDDLIEGLLACPACARTHPILDGVAIVVPDLAAWAAAQLEPALRRHDASPLIERLLESAAAADSSFGRERRALAAVVEAQWRDREIGAELAPADSFARQYLQRLAALPTPPSGVWLDVGCGAGRGTLQLAAVGAELAVGVDGDIALLRRAEQARRTGEVIWPRHRDGRTTVEATAEAGDLPRERVAFLCVDHAALPFADHALAGAIAVEVRDRGAAPPIDRAELDRVVVVGGPVIRSGPA